MTEVLEALATAERMLKDAINDLEQAILDLERSLDRYEDDGR